MGLLQKLFFQIWYLRKPPWDTNQTPPELYEYMEANPPGRALDLGCGTGTNAIKLAENGWQVTGVDFVPKAIRSARKKAKQAAVDIEFYIGDVTKLDHIKGSFDLILDIGCYHVLDPSGMRAYRNNVMRLLALGGTYMIYLFFKMENRGSGSKGSNATEADLVPFLDFMDLVKREEGKDRGDSRSAWITYQRRMS